MMLWKNSNKRMSVCLTVGATCLVLTILWAILATPETTLAKKPPRPGDEQTYYHVTMEGDLTLIGCFFSEEPPDGWGIAGEDRIRVNRPLPKICITNEFLATGGASLDGEDCPHGDGVIPKGDGPNWGALVVIDDADGLYVYWSIGETDAETGKTNRYALTTEGPVVLETTGSGTWPNGNGEDVTEYVVTVPTGTPWSLVQAKPGNLNTILTSTQPTVITFTEYTGP